MTYRRDNDVLDIRDLADEWQDEIDTFVENDIKYDPTQSKYVELCDVLGIEHSPDALRAYGDDCEPTMIHEDYFTQYAQELADELGVIPEQRTWTWPLYCIDWEWAAKDLRYDYTSVDFGGTTYYIRAI